MKPAQLQTAATGLVYRTRAYRLHELSPVQISQWQDLEDRALEPNPFLSPRFIQPAVQHLTPNADVYIVLTEKGTRNSTRIVGAGVFETRTATRLLPMPHIKAYQAPGNSFMTGLLVDRRYVRNTLTSFFEFLQQQPASWNHLEFDMRSADSAFDQHLSSISNKHGRKWQGYELERPMIEPGDDSLPDLISRLSKNRREKIRRNSRKLNKRGDVSFHVIRDPAACLNARHTFLDLEDQGWKKEGGHSLKSHTHTYDFFLDMSQRFAEAGRICFTELKVNDLVVASSCNLLSGRVGIGFKAGWESDFASLAIGNLHAVELARHAPETLADLEYFDSGTGGNSWLKALWPTSRRMTTGILTGSRLTSATVSSLLKVRSVPVL